MEDIIVPSVLFGGFFTMIIMITYYKNRRIERLSLISAGREASIFNEGEKKPLIHHALKFGILFIGVGLGLFAGDYLTKYTDMQEVVAYLAPVFIFGGIALLIFYLIQYKLDQK